MYITSLVLKNITLKLIIICNIEVLIFIEIASWGSCLTYAITLIFYSHHDLTNVIYK